MQSEIINKRFDQLFSYLKSLDSFKLGKYLSDIDKVIFVTLIRDYHEEFQKNNDTITIGRATFRKTVSNEKEEESEYGLNQGDKNLFSFVKEWTTEKIKTAIERNKELIIKIEQLKKALALDSFYTIDIDHYKLNELEQASALFVLINERKELYKYSILNLLESIIYQRAIRELSHEVEHTKISNDLQAKRLNELKAIIECFKETLKNSNFIWDRTFEERPKDEWLF